VSDWPTYGPGVNEGSGSSGSGPSRAEAQDEQRRRAEREAARQREKAKRRAGRPEPLYDVWMRHMVPVAFGKATTVAEQRTVFNASVKRLREQGVTDEELRRYFEAFAAGVAAGSYSVEGKSAFRVFLKAWPRVARSATTRVDERAWTRDDFGV